MVALAATVGGPWMVECQGVPGWAMALPPSRLTGGMAGWLDRSLMH